MQFLRNALIHTFIILLLTVSSIYAVDFSLGINVIGFGYSFSRGSGYNKRLDALSKYNAKSLPLYKRYLFSDTININARFDFNKYIALETGLGYNIKSSGYMYNDYGIYTNVMFKYSLHFLSLPVLLIVKYDINERFNIYTSLGPKLNINLSSNLFRRLINKDIDETSLYELNPNSYNVANMDISFALGSEWQFMKNQFAGLRLTYNLNVLSHFSKYDTNYKEWKIENYYIDGLSLSITYRYLFKK